jgi:hypothetical protein
MSHVVIVGDRNSGKTTFLVLLYAAQVRSGGTRADDFRFHVALDSIEDISEAFSQLMSGNFPDSAVKEGIREINFQLGSRNSGLRFLSRLRAREWNEATASLHFVILRNLSDEMTRYRGGSSLANATLRDVLESDAVVILVDSTKLASPNRENPPGAMSDYDGALESLLTALQRARSRGDRRSVQPIFVFSKFDSANGDALHDAKGDDAPPGVRETRRRASFAHAILDGNLPKTIAKIAAREADGSRFDSPLFFFSRVATDAGTEGRRDRVRLRRIESGGWEPDYSAEEYLAVLECLRKIAAESGG